MRAFRVRPVSPVHAWLEEEEFHHAIRVDRLREGDRFRAMDGHGHHWIARILSVDHAGRRARVELVEPLPNPIRRSLVLGVALIRRERLEWLVEKATELGLTQLYLLQTKHTVRSYAYRRDRLERVAWSAAKQCGRPDIPRIHDPRPLAQVVEETGYAWLALDASGRLFSRREGWGHGLPGVLVGPEGGWSEEERQWLKNKNIPLFSLGPLTLRTETAALAGLVWAMMWTGERSGTQRAEENHKGGDVHDRSTPAGR